VQKRNIFLVEDEVHIQQLMQYNLEANGFLVNAFSTGEDLLKHCETILPDMFILDLMLPGIDGLEICRRVRQDKRMKYIPLIFLTASGEEFDRVLGLEMGADDYITKPFSVRELVARVKALFRRVNVPEKGEEETLSSGDLCLNLGSHEAYRKGEKIEIMAVF
jgi:two-component system alkaline phosphatase synthesis response regulator PhoP